jgi:hypothetical protein
MVKKYGRILIAAALFALPSCADTQPKPASQNQVSTIPWNRPEKWEGQGMVPGGLGTP